MSFHPVRPLGFHVQFALVSILSRLKEAEALTHKPRLLEFSSEIVCTSVV